MEPFFYVEISVVFTGNPEDPEDNGEICIDSVAKAGPAGDWLWEHDYVNINPTFNNGNGAHCMPYIVYSCGDANNDDAINLSDAVFISKYIYEPGAPQPSPYLIADVNCDGFVGTGDYYWIINTVLGGGDEPCDCNNLWINDPFNSDTVRVSDIKLMSSPNEDTNFKIPVILFSDEQLEFVSLGLHYNSNDIILDSITPQDGATCLHCQVRPEDNLAIIAYPLINESEDSLLANLWFTLKQSAPAQTITIDSSFFEPSGTFHLIKDNLYTIYPEFVAGTITVTDFLCGDANNDLFVNVSDAVYIINYVFVGGNPPVPLESGDANCDGGANVSDAVYIINYVFVGGTSPCDMNGDGIPDC